MLVYLNSRSKPLPIWNTIFSKKYSRLFNLRGMMVDLHSSSNRDHCITLEKSVESPKSSQAIDAPGETEKPLITSKVITSFSVPPCTPMAYESFRRSTDFSRITEQKASRDRSKLLRALPLLAFFVITSCNESKNTSPEILTPDNQEGRVGRVVSLAISVSDPENDSIELLATGLPLGLALNTNSRKITGIPVKTGESQINLSAQDSQGNLAATSFSWLVKPDLPPSLTSPKSRQNQLGDEVEFTLQASDPELDSLTFDAADLPGGLTIDRSTGKITGKTSTPGDYTTRFIAKDEINEVTVAVAWKVIPNSAPQITTPGTISRSLGEPVAYFIEAFDESGDPLQFTALNLPAGLVIDANSGEVSGVPENAGFVQSTITATDALGASSSVELTWEITSLGRHGLVGWWRFDEGAGSNVADSSGHGNVAEFRDRAGNVEVNGGWAPGIINGALELDCGDDFSVDDCNNIVVIPMSDSLRNTRSEITVMGWSYRTARHNTALVAHNYPYGGVFFGYHEFNDETPVRPVFKWGVVTTEGETAECWQETDALTETPINHWYHLTGVYDGQNATLYADGQEICRAAVATPAELDIGEFPFTISGFLDSGYGPTLRDEITGRIDDVRIYNRALTPAEIQSIYEEAPEPPETEV